MNDIITFTSAAIITEGIVSYADMIISKDKKIQWKVIVAIALGILVAVNLRLDFFAFLGVDEAHKIIGTVLTGILISRGANYVYDLYDSLTSRKKDKKE